MKVESKMKREAQMKRVFDICGTMYRSNTTMDFCAFYARGATKIKLRFFQSLFFRAFNRMLKIALNHQIDSRKIAIASLKGAKCEDLEREAGLFVREILAKKEREFIIAKMREFDEVILVSATIEPVAKAIAAHFGIKKYYASKLAFDKNGVCEGRIAHDLYGKKDTLFNALDFIATDNLNDLALCQKAREVWIVSAKRHARFWRENLPNARIWVVR